MRLQLDYSQHVFTRMSRRGLYEEDIEYVLTHGRKCRSGGVEHRFLGWRDIPVEDRKKDRYRRLEGTTVILGAKNRRKIITVYRNKSAFKDAKRKAKCNYKTG